MFRCPCCDQGIKVTPAPARIIPKGLLTESALAWVVSSGNSLPLEPLTTLKRFCPGWPSAAEKPIRHSFIATVNGAISSALTIFAENCPLLLK